MGDGELQDQRVTDVAAWGFTAFGIVIGWVAAERVWFLLSRPLPRPWEPVWRELREVPGDVRWLAATWRGYITGRRT